MPKLIHDNPTLGSASSSVRTTGHRKWSKLTHTHTQLSMIKKSKEEVRTLKRKKRERERERERGGEWGVKEEVKEEVQFSLMFSIFTHTLSGAACADVATLCL